MIDIVNRLRFDATRCMLGFSAGVSRNIEAGADEIERLRKALEQIRDDMLCDPKQVAIDALDPVTPANEVKDK